ncbi:MAG TPA: ATP-binding protein [Longimicrobium sp.]|jgi:signal transduction histidine kinase
MSTAAPGAAPPRHARPDAEERLRLIIERLPDGIVIVGDDGLVRFANPAAERLFGRHARELVGEQFGFPVVAGETAELDVVRPGGQVVAAELLVVHIEWEGRPALLVSLRDVTDRREAEERRLQLERERAGREQAEAEAERARFLSDVSQALAGSLDYHETLETLARLAVPHLAEWCVIDVLEADGRLARIAVAHADPEKEPLLAELRERFPLQAGSSLPGAEALRTGRPVFHRRLSAGYVNSVSQGPGHARLIRALGARSLMAVPLVARGEVLGAITFVCGERVYRKTDLALAEDFAQRAAMSVSNARLYEAAQEASRAKSEFLAVMSHELRTPLNAITGYADLLQAGLAGPLNSRQREQLDRIVASARHLVGVIEEILTFSRMEAGHERAHLEAVDLREMVRETALLLEPLAREKGLGFEVRLQEEPARVETDPVKVRQVLRNLVTNAVKFTDHGRVVIEGAREGARHLVRVADSGVGIAPENRERVFEPFWQVEQSNRREVGGTGLGLAVARGLAEMLGGELRLESTPGRGSTFTLALPASEPA